MKNMETEFKWDANVPRAFARMRRAVEQVAGQASAGGAVQLAICDVYLDTPDSAFEKQQIAFRVRCCAGQWQATFKTRTEVKNGKAVRREETLELPGVKNLKEALSFLNQKKRWKNLPLQQLRPLFKLTNRRTVQLLSFPSLEAELAFDQCTLYVAGRKVQMKEIELELKKGKASALETLARQLTQQSGLSYMRVSKVKTACGLLKLWGEK